MADKLRYQEEKEFTQQLVGTYNTGIHKSRVFTLDFTTEARASTPLGASAVGFWDVPSLPASFIKVQFSTSGLFLHAQPQGSLCSKGRQTSQGSSAQQRVKQNQDLAGACKKKGIIWLK